VVDVAAAPARSPPLRVRGRRQLLDRRSDGATSAGRWLWFSRFRG